MALQSSSHGRICGGAPTENCATGGGGSFGLGGGGSLKRISHGRVPSSGGDPSVMRGVLALELGLGCSDAHCGEVGH